MNNIPLVFGGVLLAAILAFTQPWNINNGDQNPSTGSNTESSEVEMAFSNIGLKTNTEISSIPLSDVLGGGPPKDGIPAVFDPQFITVNEASEWIDDNGLGMLLEIDGVTRFYPYAVLYWHEIVNDTIGGKNVAVTFCPLCGSALTFDRKDDIFGVSGKLWESNLLMYDRKTETLWSQIRAEAMVGDRTGETLEILDSNVISFKELKEAHPDAEVLSKQTGHRRAYGQSPYGDYETNDDLYFPVSESDEAYHKKDLFHIVYVDDKSVGFLREDLFETGNAEVEVNGRMIKAEAKEDGSIVVTDEGSGENLPGFITMWFSWVTHIDQERVVWSK